MDKDEQLLEIYKLHSELADHVSQRREQANRLYVAIISSIIVLAAAILRFGVKGISGELIAAAMCAFIIIVCFSWSITILSHKDLNSNKFRVLLELEDQMLFPFFKKEWDPAGTGRKSNDYLPLSKVAMSLPFIYQSFAAVALAYLLFRLFTKS